MCASNNTSRWPGKGLALSEGAFRHQPQGLFAAANCGAPRVSHDARATIVKVDEDSSPSMATPISDTPGIAPGNCCARLQSSGKYMLPPSKPRMGHFGAWNDMGVEERPVVKGGVRRQSGTTRSATESLLSFGLWLPFLWLPTRIQPNLISCDG